MEFLELSSQHFLSTDTCMGNSSDRRHHNSYRVGNIGDDGGDEHQ